MFEVSETLLTKCIGKTKVRVSESQDRRGDGKEIIFYRVLTLCTILTLPRLPFIESTEKDCKMY